MRMDRMVEEAFRLNVKWSLQELSRAINGDGKTLPNPLFKVKVVLTDKIEFSPSIEELEGYVCSISGQLIETVSEFRRLPDILAGKKKGRQVGQTNSGKLVDSMSKDGPNVPIMFTSPILKDYFCFSKSCVN